MNTLLEDKRERAQRLHDLAMDSAEEVLLAGKQNSAGSIKAYRQAFLYEREAANMLADDIAFEPSRAVLHRSAAALALECGEWRAAEQLICAALAGNPPEDIAEELRALLQQTYAARVHVTAS